MDELLLSIIIPVYNVAPYLKECLDSVIAQDVPRSSYQIICVDDGSSDGSGDILDRYAETAENMIIIRQKNSGVSAARNAGIEKAGGEYLWFVDSDDFIAHNSLGRLISVIKEKPSDVIFVLPIAFRDGTDTGRYHVPDVSADESSKTYERWLWTRLYRRQIITRSGARFRPGLSYAEDNLFCAMLRPYVKTETETGRVAYFYRQRGDSISGTPTKDKLDILIRACTEFQSCDAQRLISSEDAAFIICPTMTAVMNAVALMPGAKARDRLRSLRKSGLFPLPRKYHYKQVYSTDGLSSEERILRKLKYRSYTLNGYYALRIFRFLVKIKRRIK